MPRASSMLFDAGEVYCTVICGYHEYIGKLSLESKLDLNPLRTTAVQVRHL